mmetsp:Transcript_38946/g.81477  ORF Transcript_38946/g.81477 Transcript_38946/m.81477 type:complete len:118 (+) Transcript_38946:268-621(+)|eukprot:CAMPEP_0196134744 /NCGR_PEP_ID=MMETSP0910-20130528/3578_1 /TAXON_ID=49265 /ORGANISM="Thalassiosira rotula, Strain GSO102" /LENGTH=117 /DNA_ID=CAMNT_0041394747 /DNA_START=113 /DNA_END=466 /DNA_ORIENTATION=+
MMGITTTFLLLATVVILGSFLRLYSNSRPDDAVEKVHVAGFQMPSACPTCSPWEVDKLVNNVDSFTNAGNAEMFKWDDIASNWHKQDRGIHGESDTKDFEYSVALSADGTSVVIRAR